MKKMSHSGNGVPCTTDGAAAHWRVRRAVLELWHFSRSVPVAAKPCTYKLLKPCFPALLEKASTSFDVLDHLPWLPRSVKEAWGPMTVCIRLVRTYTVGLPASDVSVLLTYRFSVPMVVFVALEDHVSKRSNRSPVAAWHMLHRPPFCHGAPWYDNWDCSQGASGFCFLCLETFGCRSLTEAIDVGQTRSHDLQVFSSRLIMSVSACNPHRSCSCPSRPCVVAVHVRGE
jgi:hypothetical protein